MTALWVAAQSTSGSMSGTVTDPNSAVVAGAKVTATHEPTNRQFNAVTTGAGLYVFPDLPAGPYTVTVEQTGFKKLVQSGVEVRVGIRQTLDLQLEVGSVQQSVEVTAAAPLLETVTAQRGVNLSPRLLMDLPIYTGGLRSAEAFLGYMPGVNSAAELSIDGSNGRARDVMIDGASLTIPESGGTVFNFPGFEAYQEMSLVTGTYNAEYGRLGGGLELMVSKSGTNDVHGAAFLNMRRDIWEAAGWSSNSVPGRPPGYRLKERYNEVGGAAGGPVYIPKVYDGRNKTFFFFSIAEDLRPASILLATGETLPTTLMKQGNFSQVAPIYDPSSTAVANGVATRVPFAGNLVPQSRWSGISKNILSYIPDPTSSAVTGNYQFLGSSVHSDTIWTLKLDHAITPNNRVAFFMTKENQSDNSVANLPGPLSNGLQSYQQPDNYRANHDLVIRPNLLLHTTFGFSRTQQFWNNPLQNGFASKIGLPLSGVADATPVINFETDNLTGWGMNQGKVNNGGQWNWTTEFNQGLSWIRGKHEIKMGYDIRRLRTIGDDWAGTNGFYYFSRAQTALPTALTTTGNAFASFLLGAVDQANATAQPVTGGQIRYQYYGGYVQDTWRVTPRLTLNLGLRYEVPVGWYDARGNYTSLSLSIPNPKAGGLPGALEFAGAGPGRQGTLHLYPTDFSDIGPRVGFAYRLASNTTLRGGWGIYYQTLGNGGCGCTDGFNGSFSQISNGVDAAFLWDQGGVQPPPGFKHPPVIDPSYDNFNSNIYRMGPNFGKAPRVYNYSFTIQHEVHHYLLEAAWVGMRGNGLASTVFLNQLPTSYLSLGPLLAKNINDPAVVAAGFKEPFPGFAAGWKGGATLAQALRPYPQFGTLYDANAGVGKLWYDSLQTSIQHRFGNLTLQGSYVFSKNLDLMTYRQIFTNSQVNAQDSYNIPEAKSYSPFDYTHVFNLLTAFELPFGRGKRFLSSAGRLTNLIVGGWVLSGAQQYRSGSLVQVSTPGNPLGNGALFTPLTKANVTGNPIRTGVSRTALDPNNPNVRWFNYGSNAPFTVAPAYTLGNAAFYYGDFRNPPFLNENLSIQKNFFIWESVRFQYRADMINLFNRTDFGNINGVVGSPNFGRAQGVQDGPRLITMGLRLEF
ncbi:MAG TPA: TonB-dependent receptor [Bryobacteraceae bacterium]|nr:TonB-dependent receptor [Bryobacteraceae bacterium]